MAEPQIGMPKADLKRLLGLAKKDPVNCAIGLGPDAGYGLIVLDKIKQPRAVEKMLLESVPAAKNTRWGTAAVNPDDDPKLVKLTLNRACSGMARRLVKSMKGTGISRVLIVLEDGTEVERHQEEDEDSEGAAEAETSARDGTPPAASEDKPALERRLAQLIQRVQQVTDPALRPELVKLAMAANGELKTAGLEQAAASIAQLAERLGAATQGAQSAQPKGPSGDGAAVRVAKGLLLWNSTRSYAEKQLDKLTQTILAESQSEPDYAEIKANVGKITGLMELLDDRLTEKLGELRGATDAQAKSAISQQARDIVKEYQAQVASDPLMADIDDNGFMPLDVRARVTAALAGVLSTI